MKSIKNKYHLICDFNILMKYHELCKRGKQADEEVQEFERFLNSNIYELKMELQEQTYEPGKYRMFIEYEPKMRLIMYLPYRDRIVQKALSREIIEPLLEPIFIYDNGANRKGKGTHFSVDRFEGFLVPHYHKHGTKGAVYKGDISKYFSSIKHDIVKRDLYRLIKDKQVIWLMDKFIDSTNSDEVQERLKYFHRILGLPPPEEKVGLPIGVEVNQWVAVFLLNKLDWYCKEELGIVFFTRYMDDFLLLHESKEHLKYCVGKIDEVLEDLGLKINPKSQIIPLTNDIGYLGWNFKLTKTGKVIKRIQKGSKKRVKRRVRKFNSAYKDGTMEAEHISKSVKSWISHAEKGDTYGLRKNIMGRLILTKNKEE